MATHATASPEAALLALPMLPPTLALTMGFEFVAPAAPPRAASHEAPASTSEQRRQGFRIGNLGLMVPFEDGSELTELPVVYRLPNAPAWFAGMSNLHGALVPVFDAAALLGCAHRSDAKPMLLVLGHGDERAGLVVDGLPKRLRLTDRDRLEHASVPEALAECVSDVWRVDGEDWMEFSHERFFDRLVAQLDQRN